MANETPVDSGATPKEEPVVTDNAINDDTDPATETMTTYSVVNDQITDSVSQTGVGVTGKVASTATGNVMLVTAHAMGLATLNAVNAQQKANILAQAVTTASVKMLLSATGTAKKAAGLNKLNKNKHATVT